MLRYIDWSCGRHGNHDHDFAKIMKSEGNPNISRETAKLYTKHRLGLTFRIKYISDRKMLPLNIGYVIYRFN